MVVNNTNIPGSFGINTSSSSAQTATADIKNNTQQAVSQDTRGIDGKTQANANDAADTLKASQDTEQKRLEALRRREEERENVIARSEDGDTLQVEGENDDIEDEAIGAVNAVGNGTGAAKGAEEEQVQIEAPEIEAELPEPAEGAQAVLEEQIKEPDIETTAEQIAEEDATRFDNNNKASSYAGISDMSLEQMYRDGIISRYEYDTEMAARKDAREQLISDDRKASEQMNEYDKEIRDNERNADAIRTATSDRTANQNFAVAADERLDAINNLEKGNNKATEQQRREEDQNRIWQYQQSLV